MKRIKDSSAYPSDKANMEAAFAAPKRTTIKERMREFSRYHGLSKRDAVFFNQSDLICEMAKKEDFIVMGRCADVILTNNHIPHISIFITAPFERRMQRVMEMHPDLTEKKSKTYVKAVEPSASGLLLVLHRRRWEMQTTTTCASTVQHTESKVPWISFKRTKHVKVQKLFQRAMKYNPLIIEVGSGRTNIRPDRHAWNAGHFFKP